MKEGSRDRPEEGYASSRMRFAEKDKSSQWTGGKRGREEMTKNQENTRGLKARLSSAASHGNQRIKASPAGKHPPFLLRRLFLSSALVFLLREHLLQVLLRISFPRPSAKRKPIVSTFATARTRRRRRGSVERETREKFYRVMTIVTLRKAAP